MSISASVLRLGRWTNRSAATIDREIDEEFDFHVECRTQELIQSGMSPEQAALEATAQFGARGRIRQECQVIGYGHNVWLMLTLVIGILLCLGAIGWMAWLLNAANQKNQQMHALVASLQPVPDEKSDLTGEIKDAAGQPVVGARVLLIFKSWPGGRYQQEGLVQTTDDSGKFRFPGLYSVAMQKAFLITVLAEGHAMQSDYVLYKPKEKVKPFRFKLQPALEKTLVVHNKDGAPIGNAVVFPSTRTPAKVKADDRFLMYDQSAEAAGYKTDANGRVRMSIFASGDSVQLGVVDGEPIDFVVDEAAEQKIGKGMTSAAASVGGIKGKVMDASGQPVAEAKVLLILKTWPKGRFQQQPSETITDAEGSFAFPVGNQLDEKEAFLVTAVKEGFAVQSRYIIKKPGEPAESPEFKLSAATKKIFALRSASGKPMTNVVVSLSSRKEDKSDEHMIYGISYPSVSFKTDADGKVALSFFATGDTAKLSVESSEVAEEVEFKVDDKPEQTVDVKKSEGASTRQRWSPPPSEVAESEVEWVRTNAIPFALNAGNDDFKDLQTLKTLIGDARIVQLGEQSHGDGSCFEAKIRLIQFLHQEMEFDVLAFESGLYDCDRTDQAFRENTDPLEAAQLGIFGIWAGCQQMAPLWKYIGESAKTDRRLELAGFDCQFTGSASAEHFVDDLETISNKYGIKAISAEDDAAVEFRKQLQLLVTHEKFTGSKKDWLTTLDSVIAAFELAVPGTPDDERELLFWRQQLRSLRAYARYHIPDVLSLLSALDSASLNARDAQMAENLIWLSERYFPNRRIIVWAASFHLMRNAAEIQVPDKSVDYSSIVPMGHIVAQKLGDDVFTIGFTAGEGQAGIWFGTPFEIATPPGGTFEDVCLRANLENAIVPLRTASAVSSPNSNRLNSEFYARPLGYTWMRSRWSRHFDALVFQKTMQPAKGKDYTSRSLK